MCRACRRTKLAGCEAETSVIRALLPAHLVGRPLASHWVAGTLFLCYSNFVAVGKIILSYKLKLHPTRNKADCLAGLSGFFQRAHLAATTTMSGREEPRIPSGKGLGEFGGRAYRRAAADFHKGRKAARVTHRPFVPPTLKAELIDAAQVQEPRKAKGFDLWVMIQGVGKLYLPARRHRAINRALAQPGAVLCEQGEVFRNNGKWYVRVAVRVPGVEAPEAKEWIGVDVGVITSVARSDGHKGPDLRPILKRQRKRRALEQKRGIERQVETPTQRQVLAKEARKLVSVAQRTGRGIALEDPKRLIRWKAHAARYFGTRVALLASLRGVAVRLIAPPYTSLTCSRCGSVEAGQRHKGTFRCWRCGYTANSDFNASVNLCHRATCISCTSQNGSLSLRPSGGEAG